MTPSDAHIQRHPRKDSVSSSTSPTSVREPHGRPHTSFPWLPILVLATAGFLALTVELSPSGLLTRMAPDLNSSVAAAGSLTALYSLGNAVLVLPLTAVVLRWISRRWALALALLVFIGGNVVVAVSSDLGTAVAGRFVSGGAHGLLMALAPAVATRMVAPEHRGRALSLVIGANTVGIALGAPLASLAGTTFGWRVAFLGAAALALVCAVLLLIAVPRGLSGTTDGPRVNLLAVLRLPGVFRIGSAWALLMLGYMAVITFIDPYLEALGVPPIVTSLALFVFGAGGIVGVVIGGRMAAKSRTVALVAMPVVMAIAYLLLTLGVDTLPVVLAVLSLWGLAFSGSVLVYQDALLLAGHRVPEAAMSIGVVLTQGGMAVGAALGGVVVGSLGVTLTPLVGVASIIVVLAAILGVPRILSRAGEERDADTQMASPSQPPLADSAVES